MGKTLCYDRRMGKKSRNKKERVQKKKVLENTDDDLEYDPELDDSVCLNCGWEGFPEILNEDSLSVGCPKCGNTVFGSKSLLG